MSQRLSVALLVLFAGFLGFVIVLADRGQGFWGFLQAIPFGDKLGHIGLVGTLSLLLNLTLRNRPGPLRGITLGTLLVIAFMTLEECSQLFMAHRSPDPLDALANVAGALLGQMAAKATTAARRKAA